VVDQVNPYASKTVAKDSPQKEVTTRNAPSFVQSLNSSKISSDAAAMAKVADVLSRLSTESGKLSNVMGKLTNYDLIHLGEGIDNVGNSVSDFEKLSAASRAAMLNGLQKASGIESKNILDHLVKIKKLVDTQSALNVAYDKLGFKQNFEISRMEEEIKLIDKIKDDATAEERILLRIAKSKLKSAKDEEEARKKAAKRLGLLGLGSFDYGKNLLTKGGESVKGAMGGLGEALGPAIGHLVESAGKFSELAGYIGIFALLVKETFKSIAMSSKASAAMFKFNGALGDTWHNATQYNTLTFGLVASGMSMEEAEKRLSMATKSYIQLTGQLHMSAPEAVDATENALEKLSYQATAFGEDANQYTAFAIENSRQLGVTLSRMSEKYGTAITMLNNMGIQVGTSMEVMKQLGEEFEYTSVGFDELTEGTIQWGKALKDFSKDLNTPIGQKMRGLLPQLLGAGMQAFSKISAEEYLAYRNTPVANIGTEWTEAVNAGPIAKVSAFLARMSPEINKYGKTEAEGRLGMYMTTLLKLPPAMATMLAPLLREATSTPEKRAKFLKMNDDERKRYLQASAGDDAQRQALEGMGSAMQKFNDPMQYIIQLLEGGFQALEVFFGAALRFIGQGQLVSKMEAGLKHGETSTKNNVYTQSGLQKIAGHSTSKI